MTKIGDWNASPGTIGAVLYSAARYDLQVGLLTTLGRERGFREKLVRLARL